MFKVSQGTATYWKSESSWSFITKKNQELLLEHKLRFFITYFLTFWSVCTLSFSENYQNYYVGGMRCVKSDRIRSYSGSHFPTFGLNTKRYGKSPYSFQMRENVDQNNSKYELFLRSDGYWSKLKNKRYKALYVCFSQGFSAHSLNTGHKLNVHKTFIRCPRRFQNVLYTFHLRPVSWGQLIRIIVCS